MDIEMKILKEAREIITPEDRWTKGVLARDKQGDAISPDSIEAVCFCAMGAIDKAAYMQEYPLSSDVPDIGAGEIAAEVICLLGEEVNRRYRGGTISVNAWNDDPSTTHKDVLKMFDRAITNYSRREERWTSR